MSLARATVVIHPTDPGSAQAGAQQITPTLFVYEAKVEPLRVVVIQDGAVAYALRGVAPATLEKSDDYGATWTELGTMPGGVGSVVKLKSGTLLAFEESSTTTAGLNPRVWRSTNDGESWTEVATLQFPPLPRANGVCEGTDGSVLIGEYGNVANIAYRVLRSTNDGVTWGTVLESPSVASVGDPGHFHSITYDPYQGRHVAFMDLPSPQIYASADNGTTWTLIGTSDAATKPNFVDPMYFENYIAWGSDNQRNGIISRIHRGNFYAGAFGTVEDVAQLNQKAFYTTFPIREGVWVVAQSTEVISAGDAPLAPGSYANEVHIVSGDGAVVTGGFAHFQFDTTPGTVSGRKVWFPSRTFDVLDHGGLSWVNLTSGKPRPYAAVPYTQGWEPPMPRVASMGLTFFDAALGKPVWWNGTQYVDATGTAV